jgi:hypothetical protein
MLWEALYFLVSLVEVVAVVALILVVGLIIAIAVFWILSRSLSKLAAQPAESDWYEDEMEGCIDVKAIPIVADDAAAPAEDGS